MAMNFDNQPLAGKVAVVTGGARGLGEAYVRVLAAEGAHVVIADLLAEQGQALARDLSGQATFASLDVTDPEHWCRLRDEVIDRHGVPYVLVNNAGIHSFGTVIGDSYANWRRVQDINLNGPFLGINIIGSAMAEAGQQGVIINVSSTCGIIGYGDQAAYVASKWAIRGLTKAAALDLAPFGIRVHVIVPGPFATPMTAPFTAELTELVKSQPVNRIGDPPEAARLVRYLVLEATYSTGSEFFVDGGAMTGMSLPSAEA
jgi:3alpha(or 20beta)-hydroxysteroid dehydrogenase